MSSITLPELSILDANPIGPGVEFTTALKWTEQIAKLAESLDFSRIWVTEHHGSDDSGCATPAVLISRLASITQRIRIGSGGVLLPNHPPLVVAEQFSMLEGLYPGRIDLGIGRGLGAEGEITTALRRAPANDDAYSTQIDELSGFLAGYFVTGHRYESISFPRPKSSPPMFILGASESSSLLAASRGLPFAFAHHQNPASTKSAISAYRANFQGPRPGSAPYAIASVRVVGRSTNTAAAASAVLAMTIRLRAAAAKLHGLSLDDAVLLDPLVSDKERLLADQALVMGAVVIGSSCSLRDALADLTEDLGIDEIMLTPLEYDITGRTQTLTAVAEARHLEHANGSEALTNSP